MNNKASSNLTTVLIACLFGIVAFTLSYDVYSGVIVENNATVGSEMQAFQASMLEVQNDFNATSGGFRTEQDDDGIFDVVGDAFASVGEYVAIGWDAIGLFASLPGNMQKGLNAMDNSITWLNAGIVSALVASIFIYIMFLIMKAKKTTTEIA
jgi:hypothetical protein